MISFNTFRHQTVNFGQASKTAATGASPTENPKPFADDFHTQAVLFMQLIEKHKRHTVRVEDLIKAAKEFCGYDPYQHQQVDAAATVRNVLERMEARPAINLDGTPDYDIYHLPSMYFRRAQDKWGAPHQPRNKGIPPTP